MQKQNNNSGTRQPLRRSWQLTLRAWRTGYRLCPAQTISGVLLAAVKALSPYVTIYLSARILDELAGNRDAHRLLTLVLWQLGLAAALALADGMLKRWKNYAADYAQVKSSGFYMQKYLSLDFPAADHQQTYDLYSQMQQNEMWSGYGLNEAVRGLQQLVTALFQIAGGVAMTVSLFCLKATHPGMLTAVLNHPLCAAAMGALMLAIALLSTVCGAHGNQYYVRHAPLARLGNRIFNFYCFDTAEKNRALDQRMYNQQTQVGNDLLSRENTFSVSSQIAKWARGPMGRWMAACQILSAVLTGTIYMFVCLKAWAGAFGVGAVTQYIGATTQLFLGVALFLKTAGHVRTNAEFLETNFAFLDIPNEMYQGSLTTEKRSDRQYEIEFRDVSFRYPGSEQYALRHVNLKFKVGSRLAVVGRNGSGKTTFIKLLCRLYDPTEGEILLNGIDIRKYNYDDYIGVFSVVFQDFRLLALPLGENVAGRKDYDRARALECLRQAGFSNRLAAMPNGLDTKLYKELDEDGVEISGGEAQKIAIARALYKDAPFIILDEPTAALDPIAEAEIYKKFDAIAGDKTAVYISHRLSSCKFCDEIVVFDAGQIVQTGSHDALVSDGAGLYAQLWHAQAQYYTQK